MTRHPCRTPFVLMSCLLVAERLNVVRLATQEDCLKARIVIEMRMERRDDHCVMFMLKIY